MKKHIEDDSHTLVNDAVRLARINTEAAGLWKAGAQSANANRTVAAVSSPAIRGVCEFWVDFDS